MQFNVFFFFLAYSRIGPVVGVTTTESLGEIIETEGSNLVTSIFAERYQERQKPGEKENPNM